MKKSAFVITTIAILVAELAAIIIFLFNSPDTLQDAVAVNEAVQSVQECWETIETHTNTTELDYVVTNLKGNVVFKTNPGLSESIHSAIIHKDTILDIETGNNVVGKIIIFNNQKEILQSNKHNLAIFLSVAIIIQCCIYAGYMIHLHYVITKPFNKLKGFAERIACGNLDIPLEMDRHNIFGVFTESFDIMRSELKKARIAEAEANASKKELVAKLSHDIKTPVASIKAISEVGSVLAGTQKQKENYQSIIGKADQINTLVTNLFTATLEELSKLSVTPSDMDSKELEEMLKKSDYFHRANIPAFPRCLVYADKLRLQQVFDNIFANSYKYANSEITVSVGKCINSLSICIEDYGGGVKEEELPLLKEKFKRGSNADNIEGAGLGLYISDYFMKEMCGELIIKNGIDGLNVIVNIPLSGTT